MVVPLFRYLMERFLIFVEKDGLIKLIQLALATRGQ